MSEPILRKLGPNDRGKENNSTTNSLGSPQGLVGLQNLGNTCYMNGALQALSNCQQLTRFILDCPGFLKKGKCLSQSYSELIRQMWDSDAAQYAVPTGVIRNIKSIYPAFRGCTQQDTQEFLRCFLEQLHDELKDPFGTGSSGSKLSNSISDTTKPSTTTNLNQGNRSIISDTFEFKISSSVVCSSCNNVSTIGETFKDLSIPIPSRNHPFYQAATQSSSSEDSELVNGTPSSTSSISSGSSSSLSLSSPIENSDNNICDGDTSRSQSSKGSNSKSNIITNKRKKKMKKKKPETTTSEEGQQQQQEKQFSDSNCSDSKAIQRSHTYTLVVTDWFWNWLSFLSAWLWGPNVSLMDCLSIFFGTDPLEGDNEYSCDVCTKKNRGVKYLKILELPEVLCIHFKRYESIGSAKITTHVSFPLKDLDLSPFLSDSAKPQCTTYNLIACICHHGSALLTGHYTTYALNCYDDQWYEFDDQYVTLVSESQIESCEAYILFYQKVSPDGAIDERREIANRLLNLSLREHQTNGGGDGGDGENSNSARGSIDCDSDSSRTSEKDENECDDGNGCKIPASEATNGNQDAMMNESASKRKLASLEKLTNCQVEQLELNKGVTYFISKQWVNKFNTFVEPGPITNNDFLCCHNKVLKSREPFVRDLCYPINESVWTYLRDLHSGGPQCTRLEACDSCD